MDAGPLKFRANYALQYFRNYARICQHCEYLWRITICYLALVVTFLGHRSETCLKASFHPFHTENANEMIAHAVVPGTFVYISGLPFLKVIAMFVQLKMKNIFTPLVVRQIQMVVFSSIFVIHHGLKGPTNGQISFKKINQFSTFVVIDKLACSLSVISTHQPILSHQTGNFLPYDDVKPERLLI